jgi:pyridinium-3,5-biscarboxylic acid mononucleotide sulfurtransferase
VDAPTDYASKKRALHAALNELRSVAVAFSGGVDSGVLLHAAREVLGDRCSAVIADSASLPRRELAEAQAFAERIGARLQIARTDELDNPAYRANAGDRCYHCKSALFARMEPWAEDRGFHALAFGEIADDRLDDRPGARAAGEFGVVAPLADAGFTKEDVRRYAREAGLELAEKPASACLASRIPLNTEVTAERLARVEAAEEALRALGLAVLRVRHHGELARVELGSDEYDRLPEGEAELTGVLVACGFERVEFARYWSPTERATGLAH